MIRRSYQSPARESNGAPIFVVGVTRSGTSLLAQMLDRHRDLSIYLETNFLNVVPAGAREDRLSDADAERVLDRVWNLDVERVPRREVERRFAASDRSPRSLFDAILRTRMELRGKRRYGEKTPSHFASVDTLLAWYPDAALVFLRRDPRSIHASYLHSRDYRKDVWMDRTVIGRSLYWCWYQDVLRRTRRRRPAQCFEVSFEDLIRDSEGTLRSLCRFLGEEYDDRMREVEENNSGFAETRGRPGLRAEVADRSRHLGRRETFLLELLCGEAMLREGRRPNVVPPAVVRGLSRLGFYAVALRLHAAVRGLRSRLSRRARATSSRRAA